MYILFFASFVGVLVKPIMTVSHIPMATKPTERVCYNQIYHISQRGLKSHNLSYSNYCFKSRGRMQNNLLKVLSTKNSRNGPLKNEYGGHSFFLSFCSFL